MAMVAVLSLSAESGSGVGALTYAQTMSRARARAMMSFQLIFMVLVVEFVGKVRVCLRRGFLRGHRGMTGCARGAVRRLAYWGARAGGCDGSRGTAGRCRSVLAG